MVKEELNYPNLQFCSIIPALSVGANLVPPSASISPQCLDAISKPIPAVYDFGIESSVVEKHLQYENSIESVLLREPPQQRQIRNTNNSASLSGGGASTSNSGPSLSLPQRESLERMKSVTSCNDEQVCITILKRNNFDLNRAIAAYMDGAR